MKKKTIGNTTYYGIGIGTMPWSGNKFWGYGTSIDVRKARFAFDAAAEAGVDLFDTAEVYGFGKSEKALGTILADTGGNGVKIATKYAPMPFRFTKKAFRRALSRSLERLGRDSVDLYQVHFPGGRLGVRELMGCMADALDEGKIKAAGVSNYDADNMKLAAETLDKRGYRLAANQVEYSLTHRSAEVDGVLEVCWELDITLIAYSPLGRGLLTGKYTTDSRPKDMRKHYSSFKEENLAKVMPLIEELDSIARAHTVSAAQVALNWIARNPVVFPIPGAKSAEQAISNATAISFQLSDEEAERLDRISTPFKVARSFGRGGNRS